VASRYLRHTVVHQLSRPSAPVLHQAETTKIRTLPGALLNIDAYTEPVY